MDPLERVFRRLRGESVDRRPNLDIHMQRAAREAGLPLSRYYLDHRALVEANLAVLDAFALDLVQAISDPYREACDLGLEVEFPHDGVPLRRRVLLAEPQDASRLRLVRPEDGRRMSDRLEAVRLLRERVGDAVPVMGWVEGPFALASVLRGDTSVLLDLHDRPEWLLELLERLAEVAVAFAAVRERGALPRLHVCGDTSHLLADMATSGAAIVDLDWMVDLARAAAVFGPVGPAPCGNFDPVAVALQGTPQDVERAVRICAAAGGPRHLSAAGCEIPHATPAANLLAHARALRELG